MNAPTIALGPTACRLVTITLSHENLMDWHSQIQEQRMKYPEKLPEYHALLNLEYGLLKVAELVPPITPFTPH